MIRSISVLLALTACGPSEVLETPSQPVIIPVPSTEGLTADELSRVDVRGTSTSIAMVAADVHALTPEHRAQAAKSLGILAANCPYTRGALQLPFALHQAVMRIDAMHLNPFIQTEWATLQSGLTTHVAVLESLGVDLTEPVEGDALVGRSGIIDRSALADHQDPIAATSLLVADITAAAEQIDAPTMELIGLHSGRVEESTGVGRPCPRSPFHILPGQPWTLGMQLGGWHDALRRVQPFIEDPEAKQQVDAMVALLDAYGEAGHAYIY